MPNYPYTFQLPPLNVQDIPNDGVAGEFLGINGSGVLDWLTAGGTGDMLKADNLSGLTSYPTARTNLGLGTGDSPTFANLTLTSPSLVSSAPVTISQTWNNAAVAFTGLKVNAAGTSGTNSASGSLLADFQLGGASRVTINKSGETRLWKNSTDYTYLFPCGEIYGYLNSVGVATRLRFDDGGGTGSGSGLFLGNTGIVAWHPLLRTDSSSPDTILLRDGAANTLALRNGGAAQTFRLYRSYLNAGVDYERLSFSHDGVQFAIGTERGGSGVAQPLRFFGESNAVLDFANGVSFRNASGGTTFMTVASAGNVGIGTTAPGAKLTVITPFNNYPTDKNPVISLRQSTDNTFGFDWIQDGQNTGDLHLHRVNSGVSNHVLAITRGAGNVGIGTTAPGAKLQVNTNSNGLNFATVFYNENGTQGGNAVGCAFINETGNAPHYKAAIVHERTDTWARGKLHFLNSSNTAGVVALADARITIDMGGNVGIGTTSPTSKLHVAGELGTNLTTFDSGAAVKITNTTATGKSWLLTSGIVNIHNEFFCIRQESVSQPALIIAPTTNNVGVGINSPPSKLTVASGDIEVSTAASGLILKSPDGTRYRITVPNGGASLTITAV